jgi:hypothetical protein
MIGTDLSPFFNTDEFADDANLAGGPVRGIFDSAYVSAGEGLGMASTAPAFTLPTAAVPASAVGRLLVVRGVSYAVAEHKPDGTGVSLLLLERAV